MSERDGGGTLGPSIGGSSMTFSVALEVPFAAARREQQRVVATLLSASVACVHSLLAYKLYSQQHAEVRSARWPTRQPLSLRCHLCHR